MSLEKVTPLEELKSSPLSPVANSIHSSDTNEPVLNRGSDPELGSYEETKCESTLRRGRYRHCSVHSGMSTTRQTGDLNHRSTVAGY